MSRTHVHCLPAQIGTCTCTHLETYQSTGVLISQWKISPALSAEHTVHSTPHISSATSAFIIPELIQKDFIRRKVKRCFLKLFDNCVYCADESAFAEAVLCDTFTSVTHRADSKDNLQQKKTEECKSIQYKTSTRRVKGLLVIIRTLLYSTRAVQE